ncbi:hypothetical protein Slin15195_G106130 [Septoria linicola]|uniref:Uncharacterized protein n=1 Tax=Septoria linicola TaxID=215465 RepID=A0A9Q9AY87_9PEZI|nr:hypothetical protein Slin15195_G106130 [Septoria linicola]
MRSAILAFAATLLAVTQARIAGFYAPQNAAPDADVKIDVNDVAISFGLTTANTTYLGALGTFVSSKFLGPDLSNVDGNITHYIHIPATFPKGPATLQAAHFSLMGASNGPNTDVFYANVTIGEGNQYPYVTSARTPEVQN